MQNNPPQAITLRHTTDLEAVIKIIDTEVFEPHHKNPLGGDSGLNAFELGQNYNEGQEYNATGAILLLEWTGPFQVQKTLPFRPNVLSRQTPWRSVVPFGSDRFLRAFGVEADISQWEELHEPAPWWLLLSSLKKRWLRHKAVQEKSRIQALLVSKPSIGVAVHPATD